MVKSKLRRHKLLTFTPIAVVVVSLVMQSVPRSFGQEISAEAFQPKGEPGLGYLGYTAYPFNSVAGSHPGLIGMKTENNRVLSVNRCNSMKDAKCLDSDFFQFRSTLNFCASNEESDCIVDVFAEKENGIALKINRIADFFTESTHHYAGEPSIALPPGKSPPIIEIPEAPHPGGALYLPLVTSYGRIDRDRDAVVTVENGEIALFAVTIVDGNFSISTMSEKPSSYPERHWRSSEGDPSQLCIFNDSLRCARAWPIPENLRLGVKLKFSGGIKGWFHGRITDPLINQELGPGNGLTLTVYGKPIQVPSISIWKKKSELLPEVKSYYAQRKATEFPLGGSGTGAGNATLQNGPEENWSLMRTNNVDFDQNKFDEFLAWLPTSGDKANLLPTVWILKLMTNYGTGSLIQNGCQRDLNNLTGIVSTNATQYLAGPPVYDASNNELVYQVAAPHFLPDGSLVRGTYDLALRGDLARCLYGVTGTNFKVTVSVISNKNELVEAITTAVEKDGWFYFSAKGFTFSSPKIRVKFEMTAPISSASSPSATMEVASSGSVPTNTVARSKSPSKKSITCQKGTSSRKITGISPKCPVGWKRK